jgi:hypothetical protein
VPGVDDTPLYVGNELSTAGPHVRGVADALNQELTGLRNKLAPISETWDSNAHNYFDPLEQMWQQAAQRLFGSSGNATHAPGLAAQPELAAEGVLGEIADALDAAYANYVAGEQANTHIWQYQ